MLPQSVLCPAAKLLGPQPRFPSFLLGAAESVLRLCSSQKDPRRHAQPPALPRDHGPERSRTSLSVTPLGHKYPPQTHQQPITSHLTTRMALFTLTNQTTVRARVKQGKFTTALQLTDFKIPFLNQGLQSFEQDVTIFSSIVH